MNSSQEFKLTVDVLVLGISGSQIHILLVRRKNDPFKDQWAIPGGFVEYDEDLLDAALREVQEETGLKPLLLKQYHAFGHPKRDPRGRAVSVAHFGLIRCDQHSIRAASDAAEVAWLPINELPRLAFDHEKILRTGLSQILHLLRTARKELRKFDLSGPELDLIENELAQNPD